ncbi:MAG TPA: glycerol-3-phosphate dehydrogenase/oxidase [Caulobacteraceae bacterium]|jgi:glycerol-3-phosphate dehydrogenase
MDAARLDLRDRDALFTELGARRFDLAVIGAGITGAGIARDAALRGLSVLLIEAGDFACGTSSRSSKMIHGGLRYLAQGDLALVREAASERKAVQAIAPHLAVETPFVIGARSQGSIARLRAGLWAFEKLGGVPKSRAHKLWSHADLAAHEPAMKAEDLAGAVVYPEYLTNDARLTLANVLSAAAAGAAIANYARVERFILENDRAVGLAVSDQSPGGAERTARVSAGVIVNAAGPWVDAVRALESGDAPPRLALSRGIHLVVRHDRSPARNTWIVPAGGGRSIFVVPKGASTYIGTTDNFYHHADLWPPVTAEDVDYLLAAANARLAGPPLTPGDIHAAWSGVRPLVNEPGKGASEISRRDEVWTGPAGVISIAGGKLTAYRRMAQRVTDKVQTALGHKPSPCVTAREPLPGGETAPDIIRQELARGGVSGVAADRLIGLYGAAAPGLTGGVAVEAQHAVLNEGALRLEDYWVRRSGRAWFDDDGGLAALEPAARAMAPLLGWGERRLTAEIDGCRARRAADLAEVT